MKSKLWLMIASCLLVTAQAFPAGQKVALKWEKYKLSNGLEVVLQQDPSSPNIGLAIQYHVGSSREKVGRTGFAHLFEHLLFQRSENLPRNFYFQNIEAMGGEFNGSTGQDGTNYYMSIPRDCLEKALWMESDRMGYFINSVTQAGLEREIDIVTNEKRQSVDNRPYGMLYPILFKYTYPASHPYNWTPIGDMNDLRKSTLQDVKDFYHTFYGPNNATLVITGDFELNNTKTLIQKYFGEIKPIKALAEVKPKPLSPYAKTENIVWEDPKIQISQLLMVYPTVQRYHKDEAALDILTQLLANSQKSPIYKVLVEEKHLAAQVNMSNSCQELAGQIFLGVAVYPGVPMSKVTEAIAEAMDRFEKNGFSEKEMQAYKKSQELALYNKLTSNLNRALSMAQDNVFGGKPDRSLDEVAHYNAVSKSDIMRVYDKYIKGKNTLNICYMAKGQADLALANAKKAEMTTEGAEVAKKQSADGALVDDQNYPRTASSFDRSKEPAYSANTPVAPDLNIWTARTKTGISIKGIPYTQFPLISFKLTLRGGELLENKKYGVATLNAALMDKGTAKRTPEQLEEDLSVLGANISIDAGLESTVLSGKCLSENFTQVMKIVEEMLISPRFDTAQFSIAKQQLVASLGQAASNPTQVAKQVSGALLYGKDNPMGYITSAEDIQKLTLADVKAYFAKAVTPGNATFDMVGDVPKTIEKDLLSQWREVNTLMIPRIKSEQQALPARLYFIDFPGSPQSYIYISKVIMPKRDANALPAEIANTKLGGGTSAELFDQLRLKNGYTYGAYSNVLARNLDNRFTAASNVQSDVTTKAVRLFKEIFTEYPYKYLTPEKFAQAVASVKRSAALAYETPDAKMNVLSDITNYHMPLDFYKKDELTLDKLTLDEVRSVYNKYLYEQGLIYVIAGDAATQFEALKDAGLGDPVLLDKTGEKIPFKANRDSKP